jgi:transcriptional regulator with XRE-family HTH domain
MGGRHPWKTLTDKMSPEQRRRVSEKSDKLRLGLLLAELRKESGLTQTQVAERLGISQPGVSQIEAEGDMQVGTLKRLVEAYGGKIILRMPQREIALTPGT